MQKGKSKRTVLVAGSDSERSNFIRMCLEGDGYHVVQSGIENITDSVRESGPLLILFDIDTAGLDGLYIAENILWDHHIPLIFVCHTAEGELFERALALSHYGFLIVPFSERQLLASLQTALQFQASESRYKTIVEDQTELICRFRPDGTLLFVNNAYCRYFKRDWEELVGKKFLPLVPEEDHDQLHQHFTNFSLEQSVQTHEHRVFASDGRIVWQQWTNRAFFNDQGAIVEFLSVGRDVTDRKMAEKKLLESLQEKELLLRELHHRVKNNLQIIISLLNIQSRDFHDQQLLDQFVKIQQRIYSMSLIHDRLYTADDLSKVDMAAYIRVLCQYLQRTYGTEHIEIQYDLHSVQLQIDKAVPCGLIINELITNSLKHAFSPPELGIIRVSIQCDDQDNLVLKVQDNGRGLPADYKHGKTLGLNLVEMLVDQMEGTVDFRAQEGVVTTITIPLNPEDDDFWR